MELQARKITLRDGREAVFRTPLEAEAADLLALLKETAEETEFLLRYSEEWDDLTPEQEWRIVEGINASAHDAMVLCWLEGRLAGVCSLNCGQRIKTRHRGTIGVSLLREFWGLGLGTAMMELLLELARENPALTQLELEFLEGNHRARRLYEKMGFRIVGLHPDAIRLKDGTLLHEYLMVRPL